jgi:hypothetical protein
VTEPQTQRFGTFIDITDPDGHRLRVVGHARTDDWRPRRASHLSDSLALAPNEARRRSVVNGRLRPATSPKRFASWLTVTSGLGIG